MTNYPFHKIEEYNDVEARNGWKDRVLSGQVPAEVYLNNLGKMSRDNARTPMQWDSSSLVVINLSDNTTSYQLQAEVMPAKQVLDNLGKSSETATGIRMEAWEARMYKLR